MKKITHYVVIKGFPGVPEGYYINEKITPQHTIFDEACKYPEFFKPVYEEEFKIGDWIVANNACDHDSFHRWYKEGARGIVSKGDVLQVEDIEGSVVKIKNTAVRIRSIRKATKEEIESNNQVKIGGHKAERVNAELIEFGCQGITKSDLESYLKLFNSEIKAELTIRGTKITEETISKLLNLLK